MSVPAYAERVSVEQVFKPKLAPSRFAPTVKSFQPNYECAGCNADLGDIALNNPIRCRCGLISQHVGHAVMIWRDAARSEAGASA